MLRTQVGLQMINYRSLKDRQCKKKKQQKTEKEKHQFVRRSSANSPALQNTVGGGSCLHLARGGLSQHPGSSAQTIISKINAYLFIEKQGASSPQGEKQPGQKSRFV